MINWHQIDTILLDLDGTLLDLHFDNYFWVEHLPLSYAKHHGITLEQANNFITKELESHRGKLHWYLTDYWSEKLGVDIVKLKHQVADKIKIRPSVLDFLIFLRNQNKRLIIATNADHNSLALKFGKTKIDEYVDEVYSSEQFGEPKEELGYWQQLNTQTGFDINRTLLIDDNLSVLDCAKSFGIYYLLAVNKPDSKKPKKDITGYKHVEHFDSLYPTWN